MQRQENANETQSHEDSQKDQRSRHLALRNSSKSGGMILKRRSDVGHLSWIEEHRGPLDPMDLKGG
jgi:hypothetical protein